MVASWKDLLGNQGMDQDCLAQCQTSNECLLNGCRKIVGKGDVVMVDKSDVADAKRFRWLLSGKGYFMEENYLCGHAPTNEDERDEARSRIDEAIAVRPRTAEQIEALPEDGFGVAIYEFTDLDRARGFAEINGNRIEVKENIRQIQYPVPIDEVAFFSEDFEITHYMDRSGVRWKLGQYRNGGWFRQQIS